MFNHQEVQNLELQGHRIITGLLEIYAALLALTQSEFQQLTKGQSKGMSYHALLLNRIDNNIIKAYSQSIIPYKTDPDKDLWEFYHRCRLIQDHISAMTDHSALDEYKLLTVAD